MVNGVNTVYVDSGHGISSPKGRVGERIETTSTLSKPRAFSGIAGPVVSCVFLKEGEIPCLASCSPRPQGADAVRLAVGLRCLGQGKMEGCPAALFRFDPDLSPMIFYDFINDCKP